MAWYLEGLMRDFLKVGEQCLFLRNDLSRKRRSHREVACMSKEGRECPGPVPSASGAQPRSANPPISRERRTGSSEVSQGLALVGRGTVRK